MSLRTLVVDDAPMFRRVVTTVLTGIPGVEVVGSADNGRAALNSIARLKPDLVTLDIEMPVMNGIQVLEALQAEGRQSGVIVVSSRTARGGRMAVKALELGAFDVLAKPEGESMDLNLDRLRGRLVPLVLEFERRIENRRPPGYRALEAAAQPLSTGAGLAKTGPPIVLIGVSTGGPVALGQLLPSLPANLGAPVFIVQHMPPTFTEALARSLSAKCELKVVQGADGLTAQANTVYIAPGGKQMKLVAGVDGAVEMQLTDDPPERSCRPSVDYLFRSAALNFPGRSIAAILTGMGDDGTAGLQMLKRTGCLSLAQDEESCIVFGMPKSAIAAGVVDAVLPLDRMAHAIVRAVRGARC